MRPLSDDDAPFILDLLNQPSFLQFIGDRGVRTLADARTYVANGPAVSYERHGFGLYGVELKSDGATIGMCGIMQKGWLPHPDLAYAFLPQYWSQGYAREAAGAVLAAWPLPRIVAVVTCDNTASARLLEKLGFTFEQMVTESGTGTELRCFALQRQEL